MEFYFLFCKKKKNYERKRGDARTDGQTVMGNAGLKMNGGTNSETRR
jgi:hypothetical protein